MLQTPTGAFIRNDHNDVCTLRSRSLSNLSSKLLAEVDNNVLFGYNVQVMQPMASVVFVYIICTSTWQLM